MQERTNTCPAWCTWGDHDPKCTPHRAVLGYYALGGVEVEVTVQQYAPAPAAEVVVSVDITRDDRPCGRHTLASPLPADACVVALLADNDVGVHFEPNPGIVVEPPAGDFRVRQARKALSRAKKLIDGPAPVDSCAWAEMTARLQVALEHLVWFVDESTRS